MDESGIRDCTPTVSPVATREAVPPLKPWQALSAPTVPSVTAPSRGPQGVPRMLLMRMKPVDVNEAAIRSLVTAHQRTGLFCIRSVAGIGDAAVPIGTFGRVTQGSFYSFMHKRPMNAMPSGMRSMASRGGKPSGQRIQPTFRPTRTFASPCTARATDRPQTSAPGSSTFSRGRGGTTYANCRPAMSSAPTPGTSTSRPDAGPRPARVAAQRLREIVVAQWASIVKIECRRGSAAAINHP